MVPRPGVEVVIGEKLGKGATATVWSGTYDGKPVAVKQISLRAFKGIRYCITFNKNKREKSMHRQL